MPAERRRTATWVTAVVLAAVLLWAIMGRRQEPPEPEGLIWSLVEAAQQGNVEDYLACFGADLRSGLESTVAELGQEGFGRYLTESSDLLTGVAVYDVVLTDPGRSTLTVEYVYRDATERQNMELELDGGVWSIVDLERSRRAKPLIPYGAPAAPMPEPTEEAPAEEEGLELYQDLPAQEDAAP